MADSLLNYAREVQENIQELLSETGTPDQALTQFVINEISEKTDLGDSELCYGVIRSASGSVLGEVNAYAISFNGQTLSLFSTIYKQNADRITNVSADEYHSAVSKLQGFYNQAVKGWYKKMEPSAEHYSLCKHIFDKQDEICNVRLFVISNGMINNNLKTPKERIQDKHLDFITWDLNKLYINSNSQSDHESIDLDLMDDPDFRFDLPYLSTQSEKDNYQCLLVLVPGQLLYNLYENYNTNLLQNNVRFFLGFKGKKSVNKDILNTLRQQPQRFLAFNNGITATAQDVLVEDGKIRMIQDFQILNGGQTTASIFFGKRLEKKDAPETYVDLSQVSVQMKLIVLRENVKEIMGDITKYSNSQKQITTADYSTNNTFNLKVQELSRTHFAPDVDGNGNVRLWYYERVKGQYDADLKNCPSSAARTTFKTVRPPERKFRKELLAKVWQGWNQFPYSVCLGDQGNYNRFMKDILDRKFDPDVIYFEDTVALLLIYNYMQKESVVFKEFHQIKAQMIGYTMAALNYLTVGKLSLFKIWKAQALSDTLKSFIDNLGKALEERMKLDCPQNVTFRDFAKSKDTWDSVKKYSLKVDLNSISADFKEAEENEARLAEMVSSIDEEAHNRIVQYGSKFWSGLYHSDLSFLEQPEKLEAVEIAECIAKEQILTDKQISSAKSILAKFEASSVSVDEIKAKSSLVVDKTENAAITAYQRVAKLTDKDWANIVVFAKRICDDKTAKCINKVSKMADKRKAKATDLKAISDILDQINSKYHKDF